MSADKIENNPLLLSHQHIRSAVQYIKRRWLILLLAACVGIAIGFLYTSSKRPLYTAELTFSLESDQNVSGGNLMAIAAQLGLDLGGSVGGIFEGDNIIELFKSRKIIEETLLRNYPNSTNTYADVFLDITNWRKSKNLPAQIFSKGITRQQFSRFQDSLIGAMHQTITKALLTVEKPDKRLNIYDVQFKCNDEIYARSFTTELVNDVSEFYIETKTKRLKQNVDILQNRTDSIKRAFDQALYGRANIIDANINPAFQTPMVGAQKKQADITVLGTAYGELLKNLELAKYSLLKETPYIQIIDEPRLPLEKKTYPAWLYVPLGAIGFICLAICFLLALKILLIIYRVYFKS